MDDNFSKWLELATDLAEKSIKNYVGAIQKISFDLSQNNIVHTSLEEISTEEELERIKRDYFLIPENKEMDEKGKGCIPQHLTNLSPTRSLRAPIPLATAGLYT